MNRMEVPQDYYTTESFYKNKLLQSIGINQSHGQMTNDTTANLNNLLRTNISLLNEAELDEEAFDYKEGQLNGHNIENSGDKYHRTNQTFNLRSLDKASKVTSNKQYLSYGQSKHRRTQERKQSTVNKENLGLPDDLRSVMIESSDNDPINDRYSSHSEKDNLEDTRGKELLTITVEIGNGQKENIIIYENDDAQQVSDAFCNKHGINDELKVIFTNQIAENIMQVKEEIAQENRRIEEESKESREESYKNSPPSIEQPLFGADVR